MAQPRTRLCVAVQLAWLLTSGAVTATDVPCPVTQPRANLPVASYGLGGNWHGGEQLAALLPADGQWPATVSADSPSVKQFFWARDLVPGDERDLMITISSYRGGAVLAKVRGIRYAVEDAQSYMQVGIAVEGAGCWEVTAQYRGESLTFIVETPGY